MKSHFNEKAVFSTVFEFKIGFSGINKHLLLPWQQLSYNLNNGHFWTSFPTLFDSFRELLLIDSIQLYNFLPTSPIPKTKLTVTHPPLSPPRQPWRPYYDETAVFSTVFEFKIGFSGINKHLLLPWQQWSYNLNNGHHWTSFPTLFDSFRELL